LPSSKPDRPATCPPGWSVSLSQPDPDSETGVSFPAQGEKLKVGDVSQINGDERVQKALKRLAIDKAPATVSQLVMWKLTSGKDWAAIEQLSASWANAHELSLAREFVDRLDTLPEYETGTVLFALEGVDAAGKAMAAALTKELGEKFFLGLRPKLVKQEELDQPEGPAVACRVRISQTEASVQVASSDGAAQRWVPFGKFTVPVAKAIEKDKPEAAKLGDALAEGVLNWLVRAQLRRGPQMKGKLTYQVRIENASPLVLNGLAVLGVGTKESELPKQLLGICIAPRRSLTVPATEEVVKTLNLRKGIRVMAADLSGL
jgi:hypothetical protein